MQVKDRSFLITGGSSGLGAACATALAAAGSRVMIADVNRDAAEKLIGQSDSKIAFAQADAMFAAKGALKHVASPTRFPVGRMARPATAAGGEVRQHPTPQR